MILPVQQLFYVCYEFVLVIMSHMPFRFLQPSPSYLTGRISHTHVGPVTSTCPSKKQYKWNEVVWKDESAMVHIKETEEQCILVLYHPKRAYLSALGEEKASNLAQKTLQHDRDCGLILPLYWVFLLIWSWYVIKLTQMKPTTLWTKYSHIPIRKYRCSSFIFSAHLVHLQHLFCSSCWHLYTGCWGLPSLVPKRWKMQMLKTEMQWTLVTFICKSLKDFFRALFKKKKKTCTDHLFLFCLWFSSGEIQDIQHCKRTLYCVVWSKSKNSQMIKQLQQYFLATFLRNSMHQELLTPFKIMHKMMDKINIMHNSYNYHSETSKEKKPTYLNSQILK